MLSTKSILILSLFSFIPCILPAQITSVTPSYVNAEGGTSIVIRGTGFSGVIDVTVGGKSLIGWSLSGDKTEISGIAPALADGVAIGPKDVEVERLLIGTLTAVDAVEYYNPMTLTSMTPLIDSYLGGQSFTITGEFIPSGTLRIEFGDQRTITLSGQGPNTITGTIPLWPDEPEEVTIKVIDPLRDQEVTLQDTFRYVGPFRLDAMTPASISTDDSLEFTIRGRALTQRTTFHLEAAGGQTYSLNRVEYLGQDRVEVVVAELESLPAGVYSLEALDPTLSPSLTATLPRALTVRAPAEPPLVESVTPDETSYLGGEFFEVVGVFPLDSEVFIDGVLIKETTSSLRFPGRTVIRGQFPAHDPTSPNAVTVDVRDPSTSLTGRLGNAVEYVGPLQITAIEPSSIPAEIEMEIQILGVGFTDRSTIEIDGVPVDTTFSSLNAVVAQVPGLSPGEYTLSVRDNDGIQTVIAKYLGDLIVYPTLELSSVEPSELSYLGGSVRLSGTGFSEETEVYAIGAERILIESSYESDTGDLIAEFKNHPIGTIDVEVVDPAFEQSDRLNDAITFRGPLRIDEVTPTTVQADQPGQSLEIQGLGFTSQTEVRFGNRDWNEVPLIFVNLRTLRLTAPPLPAGSYRIELRDRSVNPPVTAEAPDPLLSRGEEIPVIQSFFPERADAYLDGQDLMVSGRNFSSDHEVGLRDEAGEFHSLVFVLENSSQLRVALSEFPPGTYQVALRREGEIDLILSEASIELFDLAAPVPVEIEATVVDGVAELEWFNPVDFESIHVYRNGSFVTTLPGDATSFVDSQTVEGHAEYELILDRLGESRRGRTCFLAGIFACSEPAGFTSGIRGDRNLPLFDRHPPYVDIVDGIKDPDLPDSVYEDPVTNTEGGYKSVIIGNDGEAQFNFKFDQLTEAILSPNQVVTGFRLSEETRKLRIAIHGTKVAIAENTSLRVLIEPAEPSPWSPVELILPSPRMNLNHEWIELDYNTDNPPPPGQVHPDPESPQAPHDPLPPGPYRARFYTVGGSLSNVSFSISTDRSTDQMPIAGVGCPPYPLVSIRPTQNFPPIIHGIRQTGNPIIVEEYEQQGGGRGIKVRATLKAVVSDIDGDVVLRYNWRVQDGSNHLDHIENGVGDTITMVFWNYGTYLAELTVWDSRCGETMKKQIPVIIHPPCVTRSDSQPNFIFPNPDPRTVRFVTGLNTIERFEEEVPMSFRMFVVDSPLNPNSEACDSLARTSRVQMRLHDDAPNVPDQIVEACLLGRNSIGQECCVASFPTGNSGIGETESGQECRFVTTGGRFWVGHFDLKNLQPVHDGTPGARGAFGLWARGYDSGLNRWSDWFPVQMIENNGTANNPLWERIEKSERFQAFNLLQAFNESGFRTGSYNWRDRSFRLTASVVEPGSGTGSHPSNEANFSHPDHPEFTGKLPSSSNSVSGNQILFTIFNGVRSLRDWQDEQDDPNGYRVNPWEIERLRKVQKGTIMGRRIYEAFNIPPTEVDKNQTKGLEEDICDLFSVDDCEFHDLFVEDFETLLTSIPIFADPLTGGVIFLARFSTSVGGFFAATLGHHLSLEACPGDGSAFDGSLWFKAGGGFYLNAEIEVDVLTGLFSSDIGVNAGIQGSLPVVVHTNSSVIPEFAFNLSFFLDFVFEVCGLWGAICHREVEPLIDDLEILSVGRTRPESSPAKLSEEVDLAKALNCNLPKLLRTEKKNPKGLGFDIPLNSPSRQLAIASSPPRPGNFIGSRQIAVGRRYDDRLFYLLKGPAEDWQWEPRDIELPPWQEEEYSGSQADPDIIFLDQNTVRLVWTQDFSREDTSWVTTPPQPSEFQELEKYNRLTRRLEIVTCTGTWVAEQNPEGPDKPDVFRIEWSSARRLCDINVPDSQLRADGKADIAIDPTSLEDPQGPWCWVTWVRYDTPDMVELVGGVRRIQLDLTDVYVRRVGRLTLGPRQKLSLEVPQIDIQPSLSISKTGTACVVWLNDEHHENLYEDNTARQILYSISTGQDIWTTPQLALSDPLRYKATMEPEIAMTGNGTGTLIFTALPSNADQDDLGVGSARLLYYSNLSNATTQPIWERPILVGEQCETPIYASGAELVIVPELLGRQKDVDDLAIIYQKLGAAGSLDGAGAAMATCFNRANNLWTEPTNLTPDGRVHMGVAATMSASGEIVVLNQSPYPADPEEARLQFVRKGRKGLEDNPEPVPVPGGHLYGDIMGQSFPAVADPAITFCRISDAVPAPGSQLSAQMRIGNKGFGPTPDDLTVTLFLDFGDLLEPIENIVIPVLEPGDEHELRFSFTMPRDPVIFIARVDIVENEWNEADNERVCPLGAQAPSDFRAYYSFGTQDVRLTWSNSSPYETVEVFRDGELLAALPGSANSYTDLEVGHHPRNGDVNEHEYCIRGCAGLSRSSKTDSVTVNLFVSSEPEFRRGDVNNDQEVDITDSINILAYQFLGTFEINCLDAADANDDGRVDVSDPLTLLSYQFLGEAPPPAPGPKSCGIDPSPDDLEICEGECE